MDVTPRAYTATPDSLLDDLRRRLQTLNDGEPLMLLAPPSLPEPAAEVALRARGERLKRTLVVPVAGDDSFLRAAARELGVDEGAYCLAQRPAVVRALALCSRSSPAFTGASVSANAWARNMQKPSVPFDGLALMLWSLLNATGVLVLGREAADDEDFCAPIYAPEEPYEGLTVALLSADGATAFAGFAPFKHVIAEVATRNAILSFGQLPRAALDDAVTAKAKAKWIGLPMFKKLSGETEKKYHGDVFIIGDGFKSTRMFRGSVDPLTKCLHTSSVSASDDGSPLFTVTAEDRPNSPLCGSELGDPWKKCFERVTKAFEALPAAEKIGVKLSDSSDYNGKTHFNFSTDEYLREHENKLDPGGPSRGRFTLYWETKARVANGDFPALPLDMSSTGKRVRTSRAASGGSGAAAGGEGDGAAPRRRPAKRPRGLSAPFASAAAGGAELAGDAMQTALEQPVPSPKLPGGRARVRRAAPPPAAAALPPAAAQDVDVMLIDDDVIIIDD